MGSNYSDLKIFLLCKNGFYKNNKYEVTTTTKLVDACTNFEVVTHAIKYKPPEGGIYFNILLYKDYREQNPGKYVFGYYYPGYKNLVVDNVYVYYSIFAPEDPLVITFKLPDTNEYKCTYRKLESTGWDYASKMSRNSTPGDLKELLKGEFEKLYSNKTIGFEVDNDVDDGVLHQTRNIGSDGYIMHINTPFGTSAKLGKKNLLNEVETTEENKPTKPKNQLDSSYLSSLSKFFDGIIIYNNNEGIALLLEFYRQCVTTQIVRQDKDGTYWVNKKVEYSDYISLLSKLKEINSESQNKEIVTYMLDKFDKYNEVKVTKYNSKKTHTKYEHTSESGSKNPNFVFGGEKITINTYAETNKITTLNVYFLTYIDDKTTKQDKYPFVIVINENGTDPKTKKTYYFNKTDKFTDWHELTTNDLDAKLNKIEENESCITNLNLLKKISYDILSSKQYDTPPPAQTLPTPGPRPPSDPETITLVETDWNLILGLIITAIILLIIISAGIYGIYWYNTTIKLLT